MLERVYARHGITRADFDVLATLRRSGPPFQLSPRDLSNALMLTTGGMTGRLDRLEGAGLVARSPDPTDRRSLLVTLTAHGKHVIDEAVVAGLEAQQQLVADLPVRDREQLNDLLRGLLLAVRAESSPPPSSAPHAQRDRPPGSRSRKS